MKRLDGLFIIYGLKTLTQYTMSLNRLVVYDCFSDLSDIYCGHDANFSVCTVMKI